MGTVEGAFINALELPKPLTPQEKAARKKKEMREKVRWDCSCILEIMIDCCSEVQYIWLKDQQIFIFTIVNELFTSM